MQKDPKNLYMDLYEISDENWSFENWMSLVENNQDKKVVSFFNFGFVLKNYKKYLQGNISLQSFLLTWDIQDTKQTYKSYHNLEAFFEIYYILRNTNSKKFDNSIIVVSSSAANYFKSFSKEKYKALLSELEKKGSHLVEI